MNANGLDRGAMTRSSTTSGETVPWLSSITSCQVQAHRIPSTSLTSSTPSHEPHFMLPGIPSSTLTGLYRQSLTLPELSRHPYPQIYTTTASAPYPSSSLYAAHGQPAGVPSLSPYGMYYHPYHHPGYSPAPSTGDMQSFSQLIARISQQAQPQLPRPYHPSHVPHQYASQPLASPTGSPGPTPHPPTHPSPIQQLPHSALYREHPTPHKPETRRLSSRTSPLQTEKPHPRHSPLTTTQRSDHYPGLSSKDLPPPGGAPKESRESSFSAKSSVDSGEYVRHLSGSLRRAPGTPHEQQAMSSEAYSGVHVKAEESPSKKAKLGPPPLHPQAPSTHTVTTSSPTPSASMLPPPPPLQPASYTSQPHYPAHFMKGSIIQLANGELKRVEDLRTEDFVNSAEISPDLKIDSSTVVRIEKDEQRGTAILGFSVGTQRIQVTVEATLEHPFYVFGRGWSSCSPERTSRRYGLSCCRLGVGDVCISLTQKEPPSSAGTALTTTATTAAASTSSSAAATGVVLTSTTASSHRASSASPKHRSISGRHQTAEHKRWTSSEGGGGVKKSPGGADTDASHPLPLETALPHVGSSLVPQGAVPQGDPVGAGHVAGVPGPPTVRKRRWSAPDYLRTESRGERTSPAARHPQQPSQHVQQQAQHQQQQQQPAAGEGDQPATQQQQQLLLHQPKDQTAKQQQAKQAPKSTETHRQT